MFDDAGGEEHPSPGLPRATATRRSIIRSRHDEGRHGSTGLPSGTDRRPDGLRNNRRRFRLPPSEVSFPSFTVVPLAKPAGRGGVIGLI